MSSATIAATTQRNVIAVLQERELLSQITESGLPEAATSGQLYVYCGFDATAPSLHVGNLVPVMALAHFQRHGHRPILVVGGGTSMIGDPSGKSTERPLLTSEQIAEYAGRIRDQLAGYLSFEGPDAALLVNNADWLGKMTMIEFLRDIGKHFSVNAMLAKESVKSRLESEQGISFTEFSYMIVQATDFLHLFDTYGCTVQIGGHDQWGNLTAGVELIRRARQVQAHALTVPLITTATGAKFGKSEGNALWLDPTMTTPYQMYQYWINTDDRDVGHYLKVFTFLSLEEIADLERRQAEHPEKREAQRVLAFEITQLIHGEATARAVMAASNILFGGADIHELTPEVLPHLAGAVPTSTVAATALTEGLPLLDTLVMTGAQPSKGAVRRLVQQGGLYVNDQRWSDAEKPLTRDEALFGRAILLRTGKNKYHLLLAE